MGERDAARDLLELIRAHRLTEMVAAAVHLGLADALASGPADAPSIAAATGTDAPTLYRLLRGLASAGVLVEDAERRFRLAPMGELLRADSPESMRDWVLLLDRPYVRQAWANLAHAITTGENEFTALHGEDIWQWRRHEPEDSALFNRAMAVLSRGVGQALAEAFEFGRIGTIADIGGGSGTMMAAVLARHEHLRGILFDQPHVVTDAAPTLEAAGVANRCELVGGSFFEGVPSGADAYLMKAILHDWEDPESIAILRNIRAAIPASGQLLVVERVIGPPNEDLEGAVSDLHMLVMPGGRERTAEEWAALFAAAGFKLAEIRPLARGWQLIVGRPAE